MNQTYSPFERSVNGLELKDWVWYHSHNATKYFSIAKSLNSVFNLQDNKFYILKKCGEEVKAIEVNQKGKKYEIPCDD